MISFDIVKALEALPIWKALVDLPARVEALERRIKALEASASANPSAGKCNYCQAAMDVIGEVPHPQFGVFGDKLLTLKCRNPSCGKETTRRSGD